MIQEILTAIIVAVAVAIVFYRVYQNRHNPAKGCNGCSSDGCGSCSVMDLKKEIESRKNSQKI